MGSTDEIAAARISLDVASWLFMRDRSEENRRFLEVAEERVRKLFLEEVVANLGMRVLRRLSRSLPILPPSKVVRLSMRRRLHLA